MRSMRTTITTFLMIVLVASAAYAQPRSAATTPATRISALECKQAETLRVQADEFLVAGAIDKAIETYENAQALCAAKKFRAALTFNFGDCPPGQTCAYNTCVACQAVEFCDGAVDDDCDGTVDEGCDCVDGKLKACGLEYCPSESVCVNGQWSSCEGARQPKPEICNGLADEDCDGAIDNGCWCTPIGETRMTQCGPRWRATLHCVRPWAL